MVVHGTHRFFRGRMYLILCNVAFRQFPRIEDVAKLVFWLWYNLGFRFGAELSNGLGVGSPFGWLFSYGNVFGPFVRYLFCTDLVVAEVLRCCSLS